MLLNRSFEEASSGAPLTTPPKDSETAHCPTLLSAFTARSDSSDSPSPCLRGSVSIALFSLHAADYDREEKTTVLLQHRRAKYKKSFSE